MSHDREVRVHLLPCLAPPGQMCGGIAVVIDVLRATTTIVHALAAGCAAVVPCAEVDEAKKTAAALRPGKVVLGGERGGKLIRGFDLGNSPREYTAKACKKATVVFTTTNGTVTLTNTLRAASEQQEGEAKEIRRVLQEVEQNLERARALPYSIYRARENHCGHDMEAGALRSQ